jgi:hypothetical protein
MKEIKLEEIKIEYHVGENIETYSCGCDKQPDYKQDCYFYSEDHDMGATIRCCTYSKIVYGECPCKGCNYYLSKSDADKIVRKELSKNRKVKC